MQKTIQGLALLVDQTNSDEPCNTRVYTETIILPETSTLNKPRASEKFCKWKIPQTKQKESPTSTFFSTTVVFINLTFLLTFTLI